MNESRWKTSENRSVNLREINKINKKPYIASN